MFDTEYSVSKFLERLQWHEIDSMEENKTSKKLYGQDCVCKFEFGRDFKCVCGWRKKVTIDEQNSFNTLRNVSKARIRRQHFFVLRLSFEKMRSTLWQIMTRVRFTDSALIFGLQCILSQVRSSILFNLKIEIPPSVFSYFSWIIISFNRHAIFLNVNNILLFES